MPNQACRPPHFPSAVPVLSLPFTLDDLFQLFPSRPVLTTHVRSATELPEPYRGLLVHQHHMTVTIERFYGSPVNVRVLESVRHGELYARQILLRLQSTGAVVQYGVVQINLSVLSEPVRAEILAGQTPLGRVLIQHDVLRTIEPLSYFEVEACPLLESWFGEAHHCYGRLGLITAAGKPAVRVAEILAPIH